MAAEGRRARPHLLLVVLRLIEEQGEVDGGVREAAGRRGRVPRGVRALRARGPEAAGRAHRPAGTICGASALTGS